MRRMERWALLIPEADGRLAQYLEVPRLEDGAVGMIVETTRRRMRKLRRRWAGIAGVPTRMVQTERLS